MILGGLAGRIFSPLAETYALAVAASLVVALTATPALSALLLPKIASTDTSDTGLTRGLRNEYERVLAWVSRRPGRVLLGSTMLGVAASATMPFLGGGFLPSFAKAS